MPDNVIKIGMVGIGEDTINADSLTAALEAADPDQPLVLDIHSEGGSVFEGFAMFNRIKDWPGKVIARINAAAFSIASYIAMACDEIEIVSNGFFMIHNPWAETAGDAKTHQQNAELLADCRSSMIAAYTSRTGLGQEEIEQMMDQETWLSSARAVELGFADRILEQATAMARRQTDRPLPIHVFAALYEPAEATETGQDAPGESLEPERKEPRMLTPKAIRQKFPKASDAFVIRCMDEEMDLETVGDEYAKAMEEQNEELLARISAMEEENEELKAKLAAMEEEPDAEPVAVPVGTQPVAGPATEPAPFDAAEKWESEIQQQVENGKTRLQAVLAVNRKFPGLRQQFVAGANVQ